jgi:hypothetical protein
MEKYYMKRIYIFIYILIIFITLSAFQCAGNLSITNGYEYDVKVHSFYDHKNSIIERIDEFFPGIVYFVAGGHIEYNNIIAIKIENSEGIKLAEYDLEYLNLLRKLYNQKGNKKESWIFTEKGLFLETDKIWKLYKHYFEKVLAYYKSDEAVNDLNNLLETK